MAGKAAAAATRLDFQTALGSERLIIQKIDHRFATDSQQLVARSAAPRCAARLPLSTDNILCAMPHLFLRCSRLSLANITQFYYPLNRGARQPHYSKKLRFQNINF